MGLNGCVPCPSFIRSHCIHWSETECVKRNHEWMCLLLIQSAFIRPFGFFHSVPTSCCNSIQSHSISIKWNESGLIEGSPVTLRSLIIQFHSVFAERYEMDWFIELRFTSLAVRYFITLLLHFHSVAFTSLILRFVNSTFIPLTANPALSFTYSSFNHVLL